MAFSGVLKLKFGPFRLKTSILLVNVMPFGSRSATYVLRVDRPNVCGGRVDLPIGRPGFPVDLLPRSANDRRKLRFGIRYGAKGKTLRFLAPNAAVYGHWITVLREAFEGRVKVAKRQRNEIESTVGDNGFGVVGTDGYSETDIQDTRVTNDNDSMCGHRGSEELDTSATALNSCRQRDNFVANMDVCSNSDISDDHVATSTRDAANHTIHTATEKPRVLRNKRSDVDIDDYSSIASSDELTPSPTPTSNPASTPSTDGDVATAHQNVFCMATDRHGATLFSVYVPPRITRFDHSLQPEKVFNLSSVEWVQWMARDIRDGELPPEVFRLTSTSCKRLQLSQVLNIVQPFFT